MADLVITPASVVASAGAAVEHGKAGFNVGVGQVVYYDEATGRYLLADNNSPIPAARAPRGIALNGAFPGQPLAVITAGPLTVGAALTPGVAYYLSDTAGGICPVADLAAGEYPTILGIATSPTVLNVRIQSAGVAL